MHILLTDVLSCPRCGPDFGLILLADRIEARRVLEGRLGCANCRERYAVEDGFADLRFTGAVRGEGPGGAGTGPAVATASAAERPADGDGAEGSGGPSEGAVRLAALLGVTEGPAFVLVVGPGALHAPEMAAMVDELEVVAADGATAAWPETAGVSRLRSEGRLPFYSKSMHGVALTGPSAGRLLEEGARLVRPLGRLVLDPAPADAAPRVEAAGLQVVAGEADTLIAERR